MTVIAVASCMRPSGMKEYNMGLCLVRRVCGLGL
jgi:hypothetical protein